jgi:hypothetical protein
MDLARMRIAAVLVSVAALALAAVGVVLVNADQTARNGWVEAGTVDRLTERGVTYVEGARAYVVSTPSGLIALHARSPQRGEPVRYCASSGWFEDAMHGSKFDTVGRYVLGPAPRGLDRFDVEVQGDEAFVDTSEIFIGPSRGAHDRRPSGPFCTGTD